MQCMKKSLQWHVTAKDSINFDTTSTYLYFLGEKGLGGWTPGTFESR